MKSASEASQIFCCCFVFRLFPPLRSLVQAYIISNIERFLAKRPIQTSKHWQTRKWPRGVHARACTSLTKSEEKERDCSQATRYFVTITNLYNFTRFKRVFAFRYAIEGLTLDGLPSCGCKAVIFNTHKAQLQQALLTQSGRAYNMKYLRPGNRRLVFG